MTTTITSIGIAIVRLGLSYSWVDLVFNLYYISPRYLIKITKLKDGTLKINPNSNELGRSAYVCKNLECIQTLIKKKKLKSALKYTDFEMIAKIEQELLKLV